jgi:hypothetical protein
MIRALLLTLALGLAPAIAGAAVPNPSAELADPADPARPASWTADVWGGIEARFDWRRGGPDGRRLLRVEVTSGSPTGDARWTSARFPAPPGAVSCVVSDRYRSNVESHLTLIAEDSTGRRTAFIEVAGLPAAARWTEARRHVRVPPWASTLRVAHRIARPGWLETDRFLAEPASDQGARPPIVSLTFDDGWRSAFAELLPRVEAMG